VGEEVEGLEDDPDPAADAVDVDAATRDLLAGDDDSPGVDRLEQVDAVLDVIRELAAGGMTMLIATHEMSFARDVANRVCFLDAGRILEHGSPEQIFGAPREERTRQFLQRIVAAGRL
jgi:polar amino acid transport system ATP-binding protein